MKYPEFKKTSILPESPPTIETDHTKVLLGVIRSKEVMYDKIKEAISESEPVSYTQEEIVKLIDSYWKFDDNQQPISSWHDKQDLLEKLSSR